MRLGCSRPFVNALLCRAFTGVAFISVASAQGPAQPAGPVVPMAAQAPRGRGPDGGGPGGPWAGMAPGAYATVTGTISQLNYDQEAEVDGFLLSNNSLVQLPRGAAARFSASLHAGDSVTVTGMARTSPSGFQTIQAQSIKDSTSGKGIELPAPGAPAPLAGSGKIQQLNYGRAGEVNGFLLDNGILAVVPPFGASNPTSIKVGATVSYSGYARHTMNEKTVVAVQTLTINGQQITLAPMGRPGGQDGRGGPGVRRMPFGQPGPSGQPGGPQPPAPAGGAAGPGSPAGRLEEPPPPPPPSGGEQGEQADSLRMRGVDLGLA
jgi:hypothetical protein